MMDAVQREPMRQVSVAQQMHLISQPQCEPQFEEMDPSQAQSNETMETLFQETAVLALAMSN